MRRKFILEFEINWEDYDDVHENIILDDLRECDDPFKEITVTRFREVTP